MKTNSSSTDRVFVDRAVASVFKTPLCRSSLLLFRQQQTDLTEAALRAFLLCSLLASLALCGFKMSASGRVASERTACATPVIQPLDSVTVSAKAGCTLTTIAKTL